MCVVDGSFYSVQMSWPASRAHTKSNYQQNLPWLLVDANPLKCLTRILQVLLHGNRKNNSECATANTNNLKARQRGSPR